MKAYDKDVLPHPTKILIDKAGVIRWRVVHENYRAPTKVETILAASKQLN